MRHERYGGNMILYVVRHGDPDYENDSLTPLGRKQAEALVKRFSVHGLDRIYTSPLGRAKMTAEPKLAAVRVSIVGGDATPDPDEVTDFVASLTGVPAETVILAPP